MQRFDFVVLELRHRQRDHLHFGGHLADDRLELVVHQRRHIEIAGLEHFRHMMRHFGGLYELDALAAAEHPVALHVAEFTLQEVAALAAHGHDLDGLTLRQQPPHQRARLPANGRIESARQAAIGGDGDDQMHLVAAVAGEQTRGTRLAGDIGRQTSQHSLHALRIRPRRLSSLLRAAQLSRGHHLHGRGNLTR